MALFIKPLEGPHALELIPLRAGFVIGRQEGDLIIASDSKLSSRHAFIDATGDGHWYLIDNGSKNGVKLNGRVVDRVRLENGQKFQIGSYLYEIIEIAPEKPVEPPKPKVRPWHQVLLLFAKKCLKDARNESPAVRSFHPAVILDFIRGTQAETRWIIGFGPRQVGSKSMDLPIFEPGAPDVCFELIPTDEGISFKTNHPEMVQLNGQSTQAQILRLADVIKISDTEIEVDFIE